MKYAVLFLLATPVYAGLSPAKVRESSLRHHPSVLAAMDKLRAGEQGVVGARGAFDARVVSDYRRQTKHDWNTTISRTQLEKPLRFANSKVYAGSEQIGNAAGALSPLYNTGNPTGQYGNYSLVGLRASLWRNLLIDPDRAALRNAKYDAKIARAEKDLTVLDVGRAGELAYWEWVTAQKVKSAYEELVKNGKLRNDYLLTRSKKGDIATIVVTENEQYVASRKGSLQAAAERLLRAEYALSLFYRDETGAPILPSAEEAYEDYPADLAALLGNIDLKSDVDELMKRRPDLQALALNVGKTDVDLDLARQALKPQVDVSTEYYQRTVEHPNMPRDYLMVMAQVSIPIEWNLGKGNIAAAGARRMVARRELSYGQQAYKVEVLALRRALQLQLEQVRQSEIEFSKSKELVASETYKLKTGGGNLFLVNIREQAQASAEASFHEARLSFMNTLLQYQALVSTGEK